MIDLLLILSVLKKKLVIEVDGDIHDYKKTEDQERTKVLNQLGFEVMRFSNNKIIKNKENILEKIISKLNSIRSDALSFGEGRGGVELGAVKVFTTRPDTIFGATYVVLAPEHELVQKIKSQIKNLGEVEKYIKEIKNKTDIERTAEDKIKTGVELKGVRAINPATKEEIPVWIADYVLSTYGTGAIMAVPAHDERDFEFAKKYNLEIKNVVEPLLVKTGERPDALRPEQPIFPREAIIAVIKHWEEEKYLCLKWKRNNWHGFVCGGIEKGENPVETGLREIKEETGYVSAKFIKKIGTNIHTKFFHQIKQENRFAHFTPLYFELKDGSRNEIAKEELDLHEINWVSKNEVEKFISTDDDMALVWKWFNQGQTTWIDEGILVNSGKFDGLDSEKAKKEIIKFVGGKEKTTFKLRDWVFSRQRYWGEPIPIVHCPDCALRDPSGQGMVPVPEKDLPLVLPKVKNYQPTDSGESPLANITKWVNTKCPKCGGQGKRETDTMPNWAGSSWYFLRYVDPTNKKEFAGKKNLKYWTPVDWYNGGNEHTTLHLLYSRFWHKFLFDLKLVPTSEPYQKRTSHGMILGEGGVKMSKSIGNVINPDDIVKTFGADTLRLYEMFMGPFSQSVAWSEEAIIGPRRFLERIWNLQYKIQKNKKYDEFEIEKTIKKISSDIEEMKFNTAISTLMILVNEFSKLESISKEAYEKFLKLLSPFAPHITEELWQLLGHKKSISLETWPVADLLKVQDEEIKIVVQINGKIRAEMMIKIDDSEENIKQQALSNEAVLKSLAGREVKKVFYVKNRLINIVV